MEIKNNIATREILSSYETRDWIQGIKIDGVQHKLKLSDAPKVELDKLAHKSFVDFLADSIEQVNDLQRDANLAMEKLSSGKTKNIHETMLTVERAEIAFKAMNQVRSKIIDTYRELMKMQV